MIDPVDLETIRRALHTGQKSTRKDAAQRAFARLVEQLSTSDTRTLPHDHVQPEADLPLPKIEARYVHRICNHCGNRHTCSKRST
jgi:hypothetical protein